MDSGLQCGRLGCPPDTWYLFARLRRACRLARSRLDSKARIRRCHDGQEAAPVLSSEGATAASYVPQGFFRMGVPRTQIKEHAGEWRPTVANQFGNDLVGLRVDTPEAEELLARLLPTNRVGEDADAPTHFSLALGEKPARASDGAKRLYQHETSVITSRSPRRTRRTRRSHSPGTRRRSTARRS